jgi:uridine kinase
MNSFIIGITGGSGSGKTLFLNRLLDNFTEQEVCLISQDTYYRERDAQPVDEQGVKNFDLPESIDFEEYKRDILALKQGKEVTRQEYTYNNPEAEPKLIVSKPAPIIVVEGLFVLYFKEIADLLDLKVFIDAKDSIKLKRRIIRDERERGYDLEDVLYRYENHVMPTYEEYIRPHKKHADLVIPNHKHFERAQEVLTSFMRAKISAANL